uniref:Uncharacterized protein n=1 Tax=Cacopsylla melanoneura TaxID=428564 RepID=A0A8D8X124_9HEMI
MKIHNLTCSTFTAASPRLQSRTFRSFMITTRNTLCFSLEELQKMCLQWTIVTRSALYKLSVLPCPVLTASWLASKTFLYSSSKSIRTCSKSRESMVHRNVCTCQVWSKSVKRLDTIT